MKFALWSWRRVKVQHYKVKLVSLKLNCTDIRTFYDCQKMEVGAKRNPNPNTFWVITRLFWMHRAKDFSLLKLTPKNVCWTIITSFDGAYYLVWVNSVRCETRWTLNSVDAEMNVRVRVSFRFLFIYYRERKRERYACTVHTFMRILFNLAFLYLTHVMQTVLICNLFGILVHAPIFT